MTHSLFSAFSEPTPIQLLKGSWQSRYPVFMKREELRDSELGGNKWCKLAGHLEAARLHGHDHLLSVGGAWSNHLHALALAGRRFGFATTGLVRGEEVRTATLTDARQAGMQIHFIPRDAYRQRHSPEGLSALAGEYGQAWVIPEGGEGIHGRVGIARLAGEIESQLSGSVIVAVPVGSGTTMTGLVEALPPRFQVWGFQAFNDVSLSGRLEARLSCTHQGASWRLYPTQAMRTHRQLPAGLQSFMAAFEAEQDITLDPVYTIRMMSALEQLLAVADIPDNTTILALHTGGLQGRRGHGLALAA